MAEGDQRLESAPGAAGVAPLPAAGNGDREKPLRLGRADAIGKLPVSLVLAAVRPWTVIGLTPAAAAIAW